MGESTVFTGGGRGHGLCSCQLNEPAQLPHPDRDRSLNEVIYDFGECLRPDGPDGEIDEWSVYDENLRRLVRWAEQAGCFFEGLQPLREGGREHDVTFIEDADQWLKFTKPAAAGYVVSFETGAPALEPALPLEYLERLIFQNELFADKVSFVGVGGDDLKQRVDRVTPDDFEYGMIFEDGRLLLGFQFMDGNHTASGFGYPINPNQDALQLAAELRKIDWEEKRGQSMQRANLFDDVADLAEDHPAEWIRTFEIHEAYGEQINAYLNWLTDAGQSSGVLAGDIENKTLMNCTVESPDQRDYWISQQMGQGNLIIAVVENGKLLSAEETDILRKLELEKLPRIARAKAEGRFQAAYDAKMQNQF